MIATARTPRLARLAFAFGAVFAAALPASAQVPGQEGPRGMAACRADMATFCPGIEAGGGRRVACLAANRDRLSAACFAALEQRGAQAPGPKAGVPATPSAAAPPVQSQPAVPRAAAPRTNSAAEQPANPGHGAAANLPPAAVPADGPASTVPARGDGRGSDDRGKGRFAACRADLRALCADVPAGGGAKVRCLQDNQAKLSPECAANMTQRRDVKQANRGACLADAKTLCPGLKGADRRACFVANEARLSPACSAVLDRRAQR